MKAWSPNHWTAREVPALLSSGGSELDSNAGGQNHCHEQLVPNAFLPDPSFPLFLP